jgi:hypothetical protein
MRRSSLKAYFEIKEPSLPFVGEEADRAIKNLRRKAAANSVRSLN